MHCRTLSEMAATKKNKTNHFLEHLAAQVGNIEMQPSCLVFIPFLCLSFPSSNSQSSGQLFTEPSSTAVQNPNYLRDPTSGPHVTLFR